MGKLKEQHIKIDLSFSGSVTVPKNSLEIIDESVSRGELAFNVELEHPDGNFSFSVFPDSINGHLKYERSGTQLSVNLEAFYLLPYGKFEKEYLKLPAKIKAYSVHDTEPNSYYFGDDENGIYIGEITTLSFIK